MDDVEPLGNQHSETVTARRQLRGFEHAHIWIAMTASMIQEHGSFEEQQRKQQLNSVATREIIARHIATEINNAEATIIAAIGRGTEEEGELARC
jgi:redox-sensitive bicupin YhaK (pirin superfamily)